MRGWVELHYTNIKKVSTRRRTNLFAHENVKGFFHLRERPLSERRADEVVVDLFGMEIAAHVLLGDFSNRWREPRSSLWAGLRRWQREALLQ